MEDNPRQRLATRTDLEARLVLVTRRVVAVKQAHDELVTKVEAMGKLGVGGNAAAAKSQLAALPAVWTTERVWEQCKLAGFIGPVEAVHSQLSGKHRRTKEDV